MSKISLRVTKLALPDYEFEKILELVENTFTVLVEKVKNNELGLEFNNLDAMKNISHAGAILNMA